jgi:hypothetical protein
VFCVTLGSLFCGVTALYRANKIISYSTPRSKVFLEEMLDIQLVKNFPAFYATQILTVVFNKPATCHYPEPDEYIPPSSTMFLQDSY